MTEPDHSTTGGSHHAPSDTRRRRLLFRSTHRGTFENDLMIGGFVRAHLAGLTEADLDALEAVMEMPDTDLADWLTGRAPIPAGEETQMLRRMRQFLAAGPAASPGDEPVDPRASSGDLTPAPCQAEPRALSGDETS